MGFVTVCTMLLIIPRMRKEVVEKCGVGILQTVEAAVRSWEDGFG